MRYQKVILTSEDWCKPCQELKAWMDENHVGYELKEMSFSTAIPRVQVGQRVAKGLDGCKKLIQEEILDKRKKE